jgi:hypothetical protein
VCWQKIESKYSDTGWRFKQVVHSLSHILHTALGLWVVYFFDLVYLLEVFRYTKRVTRKDLSQSYTEPAILCFRSWPPG